MPQGLGGDVSCSDKSTHGVVQVRSFAERGESGGWQGLGWRLGRGGRARDVGEESVQAPGGGACCWRRHARQQMGGETREPGWARGHRGQGQRRAGETDRVGIEVAQGDAAAGEQKKEGLACA